MGARWPRGWRPPNPRPLYWWRSQEEHRAHRMEKEPEPLDWTQLGQRPRVNKAVRYTLTVLLILLPFGLLLWLLIGMVGGWVTARRAP